MNEGLKYGLVLLAGVALGAIGAVAVGKSKIDLKPFAADLISRGINVKDAVLGKFEEIKEDVEDMAAAARQKAEMKKAGTDTSAAE